MKRIINIDGKLYIENASSNVICQDGCLYAQDDRWIIRYTRTKRRVSKASTF